MPLELTLEQWEQVKEFIIAIRVNARKDIYYDDPGRDAVIKLIIQLKEILLNPDDRIRVLQAITGLPIASSNNLTHNYICLLIGETLDGKNSDVIQIIERYSQSRPDSLAWHLFPWERPSTNLPNLQPSFAGSTTHARSLDNEGNGEWPPDAGFDQ